MQSNRRRLQQTKDSIIDLSEACKQVVEVYFLTIRVNKNNFEVINVFDVSTGYKERCSAYYRDTVASRENCEEI